MRHISHYIAGGLLVCMLVVTPGVASAQSNDQVRIALLQQMVALLQQQLELLLAARNQVTPARSVSDEHERLDHHDDSVVLRSYPYRGQATPFAIHTTKDRLFFTRVLDLAPTELEESLEALLVYDGSTDVSDAYVDGQGDSDGNFSWRFAVNAQFLGENLDSDIVDELIVHELGHVVAFQDGLDLTGGRSCHRAVREGDFCPDDDSYYGQFIDLFWTDPMLDLVARYDEGYELTNRSTYRDQFVSQYASQSPHEDFAESFAYFVLYDGQAQRGTVAAEKVDFFKRFSHTTTIKNHIQSQL